MRDYERENAMTGAALRTVIIWLKPSVVHPRMNFMLYPMEPSTNEAANWYYMNGGKLSVPVAIWGVSSTGGRTECSTFSGPAYHFCPYTWPEGSNAIHAI